MERVRGTADIPLTERGKSQVRHTAKILSDRGGLNQLYHSNLIRCVQTARILEGVLYANIINWGDRLDPWHLGELEGMPVEEVLPKLEHYVFSPDEVVPGMGFSAPGESFNTFKTRFLTALYTLFELSKSMKIGVVGHYRTFVLARAWAYAGANKTLSIVSTAMFDPTVETGQVLYIDPKSTSTDIVSGGEVGDNKNGIYLIRHGETAWNISDTNKHRELVKEGK